MPDLGEHPGYFFVAATLLPLASFLLILLFCGAWSLLRRYQELDWAERLYEALGGDRGGRGAAYVATAAIAGAFLLSLTGFLLFKFGEHNPEGERKGHEKAIQTNREDLEKEEDPKKKADLEGLIAWHEGRIEHGEELAWSGRIDWLRISPRVADPDRGTALQLGIRIDSLAAVMFVMVTLVATLIHIFSIGYMSGELHETVEDHQVHGDHGQHFRRRGRFGRFFLYLSLFCFSMLNLVLADNLFQVFLSWELVGICSYLLIGFYFERKSASNAANKAFIVNRVGDAGFIIGLLIVWTFVGTFNFQDIFRQIRSPERDDQGSLAFGSQIVRATPTDDGKLRVAAGGEAAVLFPRRPGDKLDRWPHSPESTKDGSIVDAKAAPNPNNFGSMPYWMLVVAGLGVFLGCVGKSAQFPLQVWLPDAMEGPTPVSALIHAATMVAAGVYLVGRCYPLFTPEVLLIIAYVGGITLFIAASVAVVMTDIKKVLAYSTVSQLGYMMLALGVGGWSAGLFHLITHAFFKALLFLGSGAVIFGCHHEQEMTKMGGLWKKMPIAAFTMLVGVLAIAGTPLFSGWYSKDAVLASAFGFVHVHPGHALLFLLPLATAGITTFYMFRMWFMTFTGKPRDQHVYDHAAEASRLMTVPLIVLAAFSVFVGWGARPWDPEESWLQEKIYESQPNAVKADFGVLEKVEAPREAGVSLPHDKNVRQLAREYHGMAGNLALLLAVLGLVFGALLYFYGTLDPAESREQFAGVHKFLSHKWYFDELYSAAVVRPALVVGQWFKWFDLTVIDGIIHFVANTAVRTSKLDGRFDNFFVDGLVNLTGRVFHGVGAGLRNVQTGYLRSYVLFLALAAVGLVLLLTWYVSMVAAG
jgi:NADH-quinone oxidoreductase subunit L